MAEYNEMLLKFSIAVVEFGNCSDSTRFSRHILPLTSKMPNQTIFEI